MFPGGESIWILGMAVGEAGDVEFFEGGGGYVEVTRLERRGRGGGWYNTERRAAWRMDGGR